MLAFVMPFAAWPPMMKAFEPEATALPPITPPAGRSLCARCRQPLIDPPTLPQPYGLSAWRPRVFGETLLLPVWTADQLFNHPELDKMSLLRSPDALNFGSSCTSAGGSQASARDALRV